MKIEIRSTMTVIELKEKLQFKYEVLTTKGNIAGDDRKLRAMTEFDISKGIIIEINLEEDIIKLFHSKTGIALKKTDGNSLQNSQPLKNSENELIKFHIIRDAKDDYNTSSIGCEIAIGKLSKEDVKNIIELVENDKYFDLNTRYFGEWNEIDSEYHKTGLLVINSLDYILDEIEIGEDSTNNWEFNIKHIEDDLGLSKLQLPNNSPYLISIRNEEFFIYGEAKMPESKSKYKLDLFYDTIEPLHKYNGICFSEMAIIHSAKIDNHEIDFDFDKVYEMGGFNYDINQFVIYNGKIIAWFNSFEDECPKFQWQNGVDEDRPYISEYLLNEEKSIYNKHKSTILTELKKIK